MYVGVKETVIDRIAKRLAEIRRDNRTAEFVAVTHEEYDELRCDLRCFSVFDDPYMRFDPAKADEPVANLKVTTRDFPLRNADPYKQPYLRTMQRGTVMGVPLFIVPAAYMPR